MSTERPTCDHCGRPGHARYRHRHEDRWIDVCAFCKPAGVTNLSGYHTRRNAAYPAERLYHVNSPYNFKLTHS